jgi:hypothetical protein
MSELIKPPAPVNWKFRLSLAEADLKAQLGNHRLLSLQTFLKGGKRVYSAVSVKDLGLGGSWSGHIKRADLTSKLGTKFRLTALDCFEEQKTTFCAAAWVDNAKGIKSGWDVDLPRRSRQS